MATESAAVLPTGSSHLMPRNPHPIVTCVPLWLPGSHIRTCSRFRIYTPSPPTRQGRQTQLRRPFDLDLDEFRAKSQGNMAGPRGASAGRPIYLYTDTLTRIHPGRFIAELPRVTTGPQDEPARVLFDPTFSECAGPSSWVDIRRRLPSPCTVPELPDFQFVIYSHNQCVLPRPSVVQ